jgi:hypothetical protein
MLNCSEILTGIQQFLFELLQGYRVDVAHLIPLLRFLLWRLVRYAQWRKKSHLTAQATG